jgi:hypothetical protein
MGKTFRDKTTKNIWEFVTKEDGPVPYFTTASSVRNLLLRSGGNMSSARVTVFVAMKAERLLQSLINQEDTRLSFKKNQDRRDSM